ncbi:MAG TPA: serine peptidase [Gammaproteobacteria bacterium]|nr:serine peptidase [Gammaproteobacteria bacterium]
MIVRQLFASWLLIGSLLTFSAQAAGLPEFTELVEQKGPAVVNISTTQKKSNGNGHPRLNMPDIPEGSPFHDFFEKFFKEMPQQSPDKEFNARSLGSGFLISADGYVLTSAHVVEGADEILVRLTDRRELLATVVGADKRSDVALLKVEASGLPYLKPGKPDDLKVGEWVLAIGSPFGFENSATAGIVSAKGRSLPNENYIPFIQTDVAINPGNSGGPLFNMDGEVVGINAQIYSRSGGYMGLAFSVPIDLAMQVAEQLKNGGHVKRGWLGITIQNVSRDMAEALDMNKPYGALVAHIMADSPASRSDLRVQDVIVAFNDVPVKRSSDLPFLVGRTPVDTDAKVTIIRAGNRQDLTVNIGELPEDQLAEGPSEKTEKEAPAGVLGMTTRDLSDEEKKATELEHGVLVTAVEASGPAAQAGIRQGDVILMLAKQKVTSVEQLTGIVRELKEGKSVAVLVKRGKGSQFLVIKP